MPLTRSVALLGAAVGLLACVARSEPFAGPQGPRAPLPTDAGRPARFSPTVAGAAVGPLVVERELRTVFHPDATQTTVAVCTTYAVGGRDDPPSLVGLSELVRILAEQATDKQPNGGSGTSDATSVRARGGITTSQTTPDFTQYCSELPAEELSLAFEVEARRMRTFRVTDEELGKALASFTEQERRTLGSSAVGVGRLRALSLQGYPAYRPVQLEGSGLALVPKSALERFVEQHYRPSNALVSVAGHFDPSRAKALIRQHLDPNGVRERLERARPSALPRQTSERFLALAVPELEAPEVHIGWALADPTARDLAALSLAAALLGAGDASMLPAGPAVASLFREPPEVRREGLDGPELFRVGLKASKGVRLETLEQVFSATLSRLQQAGPTEPELERARSAVLAALGRPRGSLAQAARAGELAELSMNQRAEAELASVTREDVRSVLSRELSRTRRVVVELYPPALLRAPVVPVQRFHIVKAGDNLTIIAKRYGVGLPELRSSNGLSAKAAIFPGQKLKLPAGSKGGTTATKAAPRPRIHRVVSGDTLIGIAKRYRVSARELARHNGHNSKKPLRIGQELVVPPPP